MRFSWKKERGINKDSLALNVLCSEFFGEALSSAPAPSTERLEVLEETVASIVHELQALAQTVDSLKSTGALLGDLPQTTTRKVNNPADSENRLLVNQGEVPSDELERSQVTNESLSNLLPEPSWTQLEILSHLATMPQDIGVGRETGEPQSIAFEAVGDEKRMDAPLSSAPSSATPEGDLADKLPNELLKMTLQSEAISSDLKSKLPNDLLDPSIQSESGSSDLRNESLLEPDGAKFSFEQQGSSESLTATELAKMLEIGERAVGMAAEKGNDYFREWSAKKGKGTWDFQVLNPGGKKIKRVFFSI